MMGIISAEVTRRATGCPLWKPRMIDAIKNAGTVSQKPQPISPFMRLAKKTMNLPSAL